MNNVRRKKLDALLNRISAIQEELCMLRDEELEVLENIPENLQSTERYFNTENACECLEDACDCLEDCCDSIIESMN